MTTGNGNGDEHENGNGHPYRVLMEDADLAERFTDLIAASRAKGLTEEEIGFGLFSATVEAMLSNGQSECCVMQLLMDFSSSYFEYWHNRMADDEEWDEDQAEE